MASFSSTSSIQKSFKYDVFLSFRGQDTRKNFIDHLYDALKRKGINTYKDDESLNKGKRISDELIRSIEGSKFYIIVFSKSYAASSWCLEELVKIMECQKMDEHTAFPVFFDVEPSEIRKQSGSVKRAFAKHRNEKDARRWRDALKEAAELAGWELKDTTNGHEAKFIQQIVEKISLEVRCINSSLDGKLVGMEARVKDVVLSLETGVDDVRMIGIKGMGGAGKTTLARAVFDQISIQFEGSSFVENVREVSNDSAKGLKSLQKQVLYDVLNNRRIKITGVSDGKIQIKKMLCSRKVLIVLDDVDHVEQLKALVGEQSWFKTGSRIIITTRDEQVLVAHRVNFISDVTLLSREEAICLFSRYAFGTEIPIRGYKELSEKVVHYAAGLPLTVSVLGSFFCGKGDDVWADAIERLTTIPLKETLDKLELSYTALEDDYKEMFLDVACIMKGWEKDKAIIALESCGFHAKNGLKVLEQKSLITVSKYGYLGMHDHLEEMGKNIVRRLHPNEPHKHSRLWIDKEIEYVLASDSGTEATRCITMWTVELDPATIIKSLVNMKELRLLQVNSYGKDSVFNHREFDEVSRYLPNVLCFLSWFGYPFTCLPKKFQVDNLAGLELRNSSIIQLWEWGEIKVLNMLRFIDLSNSKLSNLDLRLIPNIETLILQNCDDLVGLDVRFGSQKLRILDLSGSKLRVLYLGGTPNLEVLDLKDCNHLVELHMHGEILKLKSLNLRGTNLRGLDLGPAPNLEVLELTDCNNLVELNICGESLKLKSLELLLPELKTLNLPRTPRLKSLRLCLPGSILRTLDLVTTPNLETLWVRCSYDLEELESFLQSIGSLRCLTELKLEQLNLPNNINLLKHLKVITLKDCSLLEPLPDDLGKLKCLEELNLSYSKIEHLPNSFCMLKHLKVLKLKSCLLLEQLPDDLGRLECLEVIILLSTEIKHLPTSICMLKQLKVLKLKSCLLLQKLPEDLGRLECLEQLHLLECSSLRGIPNSVCEMKHLKYLYMSGCILVETLPEEFGRMECLKVLNIDCTGIRHLPRSISRLEGLRIYGLP